MREAKQKQKQKDDKEKEGRLQALCNQVHTHMQTIAQTLRIPPDDLNKGSDKGYSII